MIIRRAIKAPLRQNATNANKPGWGYNAAMEVYEDLIKSGVIDPTKVVRSGLQNAASEARAAQARDNDAPAEPGTEPAVRAQHLAQGVLNAVGGAFVGELAGKVARYVELLVELAQEHQTCVARQLLGAALHADRTIETWRELATVGVTHWMSGVGACCANGSR